MKANGRRELPKVMSKKDDLNALEWKENGGVGEHLWWECDNCTEEAVRIQMFKKKKKEYI